MAAKTVHQSNVGEDFTQIVASINQLQAAVAELQTVLNRHLTDGTHKAAASVVAGTVLTVLPAPDTIVLGY